MKTRYILAACAATVITGAGIGHALMPADLATGAPVSRLTPCPTEDSTNCHWDAQTQGNGQGESFDAYAPYCLVERDNAPYLTVAGPAGGWIWVDGEEGDHLVEVDEDVADEASPYLGIRFNVRGQADSRVFVDGIECETT